MSQLYHFISGLPRSGSTLLAALLAQNPRFQASMSSPVGSLFKNMQKVMHPHNESSMQLPDKKRHCLLEGLFHNYYADEEEKDIIFDTNRLWTSELPLVKKLFPNAKVLCCVRNPAWIMDSFEQQLVKHPFEISALYNNDSERSTVYTRVDSLALYDRVFGFAWSALKEAYYGANAAELLLIDYDLLTQSPEKTLRLVYKFLDIPYYEGHDFNNVNFDAKAFDKMLGMPSLHHVRKKVQFQTRQTILPPDLFERFEKLAFWHDGTQSAANVIAIKPKEPKNKEKI